MMVVHSSTSASPCMKRSMCFSSSPSGIWPCATMRFASGTTRASIFSTSAIDDTRLCT